MGRAGRRTPQGRTGAGPLKPLVCGEYDMAASYGLAAATQGLSLESKKFCGVGAMKIGDLAKATGTQAETIRYYEREGLLPEPARTDANYRQYDQTHAARLNFIRHCRSLDMTLDEIRALLRFKDDPAGNCAAVNELLDEHINHVAERLRELKRLQAGLKDLRAQCDAQGASCGILGALEKRKSAAQPTRKPHGGPPRPPLRPVDLVGRRGVRPSAIGREDNARSMANC